MTVAYNATEKPKTLGSLFLQLLFSHIGIMVVIILYTVFGAEMFIYFESESEMERYEEKKLRAQAISSTVDYNMNLFWFYGDRQNNLTEAQKEYNIHGDMMRLEQYILDAVFNHGYDGTYYGWDWDWTFMNSLLLCMTILTTIGYGNISPVTFEGKMFCISYALIGCPLFLVFLANLGDSMAQGFIYIYSRCCCRVCRSRRYLSELPENVSRRHRRHVIDDVVGNEDYMPTSKVFVPITINIVLLHLYFFMGAILFVLWEDGWTRTGAFYFTFVTLSTIGYGDYVPGDSLTDSPDSIGTTLKLLTCVTYIVLGMALLSMCINLMQEQLVEKCNWLGRKLGISGSGDEVSKAKPVDARRDSLMPIMENKKGPSPFRNAESPLIEEPDIEDSKDLPGIICNE